MPTRAYNTNSNFAPRVKSVFRTHTLDSPRRNSVTRDLCVPRRERLNFRFFYFYPRLFTTSRGLNDPPDVDVAKTAGWIYTRARCDVRFVIVHVYVLSVVCGVPVPDTRYPPVG